MSNLNKEIRATVISTLAGLVLATIGVTAVVSFCQPAHATPTEDACRAAGGSDADCNPQPLH